MISKSMFTSIYNLAPNKIVTRSSYPILQALHQKWMSHIQILHDIRCDDYCTSYLQSEQELACEWIPGKNGSHQAWLLILWRRETTNLDGSKSAMSRGGFCPAIMLATASPVAGAFRMPQQLWPVNHQSIVKLITQDFTLCHFISTYLDYHIEGFTGAACSCWRAISRYRDSVYFLTWIPYLLNVAAI